MAKPLLRTLILYLAVVIAVRSMGKAADRRTDPSELVVTILVSGLAAVPMQDLGILIRRTGSNNRHAVALEEILMSYVAP